MKEWTGFEPKMWGPTMIGFGKYHYKYASDHEGDGFIIGFSTRKTAFSLYVYSPTDENKKLLEDLGKFKMGKACIYVKKLSDINLDVLEKLCKNSIAFVNENTNKIISTIRPLRLEKQERDTENNDSKTF